MCPPPQDAFAKETFKLGVLTGFRHFSVELRGREELLLTVHVGERMAGGDGPVLLPVSLSPERQLPPASPCQRERVKAPWEEGHEEAPSSATFLIGGYAHYNMPYVWIRAGHAIFGPDYRAPGALDAPVQLEATRSWRQRAVHPWELVAELVAATRPSARSNPFELELDALERLPLMESLLLSGGIAAFLREVHLTSDGYAPQVEPDLMHLLRHHYSRLPRLANTLLQADTLLPEPPVHGERSRVASRSFGSDSPGPGGTPYVRPHGVSRGFPNPSPLTGRVTGSGVGAAPAGAGLTDGWRAR